MVWVAVESTDLIIVRLITASVSPSEKKVSRTSRDHVNVFNNVVRWCRV
jgi:hypothetical protein